MRVARSVGECSTMLLLDVLMLTLNILAIGLPVSMAMSSYETIVRGHAGWRERASWLPPALGVISAALILVIFSVVYWLGYQFIGFPAWMGWPAQLGLVAYF
jgi:hypothetical protein